MLLSETFPIDHHLTTPALLEAAPGSPWCDATGRSLYPLDFPDIRGGDGVFVPSLGSLSVWRHLFAERLGADAARALDVGCGSGLQAIQLARNGAAHVDAIDVDPMAAHWTRLNALRNGVAGRVHADTADLFAWEPRETYDVVVASLFQAPVHPDEGPRTDRPVDFWGRRSVDRLLSLLPDALAPGGAAYVLHLSFLSQERTQEVLAENGLTARVADLGFYPFTRLFDACAGQIARVEALTDAHHLRIAGTDVAVAYLLEVTRA